MITAQGSIWLTHPRAGTVSRIEPASGRTVATIPVGGSAYGMAADERGVWIALPGDGVVRRIDPETNSVAETIEIGGDPLALASDGQFLWVISSSDALVLRIPPATVTRASRLRPGRVVGDHGAHIGPCLLETSGCHIRKL
jgi:DNA-binding beta-propeller fold protein YncE